MRYIARRFFMLSLIFFPQSPRIFSFWFLFWLISIRNSMRVFQIDSLCIHAISSHRQSVRLGMNFCEISSSKTIRRSPTAFIVWNYTNIKKRISWLINPCQNGLTSLEVDRISPSLLGSWWCLSIRRNTALGKNSGRALRSVIMIPFWIWMSYDSWIIAQTHTRDNVWPVPTHLLRSICLQCYWISDTSI